MNQIILSTDIFTTTCSLIIFRRCIQNPFKHLRRVERFAKIVNGFQLSVVHYFRKTLHLWCLAGFWNTSEYHACSSKTVRLILAWSQISTKIYSCRHTTSIQRRYDVARHPTTSYRRWNHAVCLRGRSSRPRVFCKNVCSCWKKRFKPGPATLLKKHIITDVFLWVLWNFSEQFS